MAGIATSLLPGDAELARRAAGGDGAAFVHLYDHYSAALFEASLAATGEVETAADVTQAAFLQLLRRPPAMGAPNGEVLERLRALAVRAAQEGPRITRRSDCAAHAPAGAGVGWLRSETVAKAAARFDDDWSVHLAQAPVRPPAERVAASEQPLALPVPVAAERSAADPLPPMKTRSPKRRRRRPGPPAWLALPSPAAAGAAVLLALVAGVTAVVLMSAKGGSEPVLSEGAALAQAEPPADAGGPLRVRSGGERPKPRRSRRAGGGRGAAGARAPEPGLSRGGTRETVRRSSGGTPVTAPGARLRGAPPSSGTGPRQALTPGGPRTPAPVNAPSRPPSHTTPAPADEPAPTQPAAPAPTTTTAQPAPQGQPNYGASRNCNSKKSSEPC